MKLLRAVPWFAAAILAAPAFADKIYVFYPSMAKPNVVQAALQAKLAGHEVTVFGRLADFSTMIGQTPPEVIVAPKALADQFAGYKPFLKGARKGGPSEECVLISTKPVNTAAMATVNLGVVGVLERSAMNGFVQGVVGAQPKLKIVTKVEDLLPLLTFGSADAVLVGETQVDELKGRSQAALQTTPVAGSKIGLVVAASKGDASNVEAALKGLGAAEKKMLGVDAWIK
ncbi:MAG: hypothetical protein AAB214_15700 [Fibrobacterota bacterium]